MPVICHPSLLALALAVAVPLALVAPGPGGHGVQAQPAGPPARTRDVDPAVAEALFERAQLLYAQGAFKDAKALLIESLELGPEASLDRDARALLRAINKKLGLALDHGMPSASSRSAPRPASDEIPDEPADPYEPSEEDEELADPYGDTTDPLRPRGPSDRPLDGWGQSVNPYGRAGSRGANGANTSPGDRAGGVGPLGDRANGQSSDWTRDRASGREEDLVRGRKTLTLYGGLVGFVAGMALVGPEDDQGNTSSAIALGAVMGAGGLVGSYYAAKRHPYTEGQADAISASGILGGALFGYFADVVTGVGDSSTNQVYRGVALGALAGTGIGLGIAHRLDPSPGDVALTSSFGLYGMFGGLLLGVAIDPPESEAYSINALVGTGVGLAAGLYAAKNLETSGRRMLWVDLGAAAGAAAPWLLIYPLIGSDEPSNDTSSSAQAVGLLSTLGLAAGGYVAWRLTRKMDANLASERADRAGGSRARDRRASAALAPPPGLIQRHADGRWDVGPLSLHPAENPALAPARSARGLAVDLLGGRF